MEEMEVDPMECQRHPTVDQSPQEDCLSVCLTLVWVAVEEWLFLLTAMECLLPQWWPAVAAVTGMELPAMRDMVLALLSVPSVSRPLSPATATELQQLQQLQLTTMLPLLPQLQLMTTPQPSQPWTATEPPRLTPSAPGAAP